MNLVAKEAVVDRDLRRVRREAAAAVVEENDIAKWLSAQRTDLGVTPGPASVPGPG